jgi:hypothetical protein
MARFTIRRTITALAAAVTLTATLVGNAAQATSYHSSKFLQVYSMAYVADARAKAWQMKKKGFSHAAIYRASNGYYAVVAGKVPYGKEHVVKELKHWGKIPHDSFLTSGRAYVEEISLHKPKHTGAHGHVSGYKPAAHKVPTRHGHHKVIVYAY